MSTPSEIAVRRYYLSSDEGVMRPYVAHADHLAARAADAKRIEVLERELADAAEHLQKFLPIGQVRAIGLREVAAGVKQLTAECDGLRGELAGSIRGGELVAEELLAEGKRRDAAEAEAARLAERVRVLTEAASTVLAMAAVWQFDPSKSPSTMSVAFKQLAAALPTAPADVPSEIQRLTAANAELRAKLAKFETQIESLNPPTDEHDTLIGYSMSQISDSEGE